jgi:hypothetical protein
MHEPLVLFNALKNNRLALQDIQGFSPFLFDSPSYISSKPLIIRNILFDSGLESWTKPNFKLQGIYKDSIHEHKTKRS